MTDKQTEPTVSEQLHDFLASKFGADWRRDITLTLRADLLYWLLFLAERGVEAKRQEFRASGTAGASEAASLASWRMDLETVLGKVKAALTPMPRMGPKGK
jgi:hypothetical protein